jgi:hypothetical protein
VEHHITDCKTRVVFSPKETNKDKKQYYREKEKRVVGKDGLSESVELLPKINDPKKLKFCKNIISTVSKPLSPT